MINHTLMHGTCTPARAHRLRSTRQPRGHVCRVAACLVPALLLSACASGPAFEVPERPQPHQAVLYLYRTAGIQGVANRYDASFSGQWVGRLMAGSYLRVLLPADGATRTLRVQGCVPDATLLSPLPGQTLYLQAQIQPRALTLGGKSYFNHQCMLVARPEADALPEITGLRRSDEPR